MDITLSKECDRCEGKGKYRPTPDVPEVLCVACHQTGRQNLHMPIKEFLKHISVWRLAGKDVVEEFGIKWRDTIP
jgi:DnaJ-class molecular chaperone